jgi:hypothetical protein
LIYISSARVLLLQTAVIEYGIKEPGLLFNRLCLGPAQYKRRPERQDGRHSASAQAMRWILPGIAMQAFRLQGFQVDPPGSQAFRWRPPSC